MSKKSKRSYRHVEGLKKNTGTATSMKGDDFDPDYSDVVKDLKRIGILAGTFIAILVALSFVL